MKINGKPLNFLIITTDEERFPPVYENDSARQYRLQNSVALGKMRRHGLEFLNHHTATTACAPSRTSIYTGQYPSLHGVSQTPGIGKSSYDQNMFWLEPDTVPTLGNYFRQAGYQTWYRGKWHISNEDIDVPGTQTALMSNAVDGTTYPERIALYEEAECLDKYGFSGWIGPEPHGSNQANDGTVRDPGFADQVCRLLLDLDEKAQSGEEQPFLLVSSFVNPHDIVFSGIPSWFPNFEALKNEGKLPFVAPAPTAGESLESKPRCQKDYVYTYPRMYLPQPDDDSYRQLYYFLMAEVNKHIDRVYETLQNTSFAENTVVVFLSDHGEMLGAHGGLHQKWYNAYQETVHVPFIISNPVLFPEARQSELLTSHVDLLPTLLSLADIDAEAARKELARSHSEARPLVGRDLSEFITERQRMADEPVYFMTDDSVEEGSQMTNAITGLAFDSIIEPKHLETVVTKLPERTGDIVWKYTRYFDNPRFYTQQNHRFMQSSAANLLGAGNPDNITTPRGIPDEYECYNLTEDPLEEHNLTSPLAGKALPDEIRHALEQVLVEQRLKKRLLPHTLNNEDSSSPGPLRR
ncbi:sulfatase-like hydrolase/transferase [Pseudovibrio ascidiaceicola]|uniref:sulfatase-like hydrolase/transferase n=1 Tax=Pseudovibrio ascidiaceicola TaxID=285279 RepID=UPI003D35CE73